MIQDFRIKQDVTDELDYDARVDSADVEVTVERALVRLEGHVPAHCQKLMAEQAVWRIAGVRGIVQDIEVRPVEHHRISDEQLEHRAVELLRVNAQVPEGAVELDVHNGWLELRGEVAWRFQGDAAEAALSGMIGLLGMLNRIQVVPAGPQATISERIEQALHRHVGIETSRLKLTVLGGKAILDGRVRTAVERAAILQSVWSAPGVIDVVDNLSR